MTVVVVEAEAETVAISEVVVGGVGSGANGSEICASEGTEESAARESMLHHQQNRQERRGKDTRYTRLQMTKKGQLFSDGSLSKQKFKIKLYSPSPKRSIDVQYVSAYEEMREKAETCNHTNVQAG